MKKYLRRAGYCLRLLIKAPIWFLYPDPEKPTWPDFKAGLLGHQCVPDPTIHARFSDGIVTRYRRCNHSGCERVFIIDSLHTDGAMCD